MREAAPSRDVCVANDLTETPAAPLAWDVRSEKHLGSRGSQEGWGHQRTWTMTESCSAQYFYLL